MDATKAVSAGTVENAAPSTANSLGATAPARTPEPSLPHNTGAQPDHSGHSSSSSTGTSAGPGARSNGTGPRDPSNDTDGEGPTAAPGKASTAQVGAERAKVDSGAAGSSNNSDGDSGDGTEVIVGLAVAAALVCCVFVALFAVKKYHSKDVFTSVNHLYGTDDDELTVAAGRRNQRREQTAYTNPVYTHKENIDTGTYGDVQAIGSPEENSDTGAYADINPNPPAHQSAATRPSSHYNTLVRDASDVGEQPPASSLYDSLVNSGPVAITAASTQQYNTLQRGGIGGHVITDVSVNALYGTESAYAPMDSDNAPQSSQPAQPDLYNHLNERRTTLRAAQGPPGSNARQARGAHSRQKAVAKPPESLYHR